MLRAEAKKLWNSSLSYDAWLIWTVRQKESSASADLVNTDPLPLCLLMVDFVTGLNPFSTFQGLPVILHNFKFS